MIIYLNSTACREDTPDRLMRKTKPLTIFWTKIFLVTLICYLRATKSNFLSDHPENCHLIVKNCPKILCFQKNDIFWQFKKNVNFSSIS